MPEAVRRTDRSLEKRAEDLERLIEQRRSFPSASGHFVTIDELMMTDPVVYAEGLAYIAAAVVAVRRSRRARAHLRSAPHVRYDRSIAFAPLEERE